MAAQAAEQQLAAQRGAAGGDGVFGVGLEPSARLAMHQRAVSSVPERWAADGEVQAVVGVDAAQFQLGRTGAGEHEALAAQGVGAGVEVAGLHEQAHGALGHLQAVARAGPAGGGQVGAAQAAVFGDGAEDAVPVHRRTFARRRQLGPGRGGAQQAVEQVRGQSHGAHLASVDARCSHQRLPPHLPMRRSPAETRSRRCQPLRIPGGRTCALKAGGAARTLAGLDAHRQCSAAACTPHRLNVGVSRRKPPA